LNGRAHRSRGLRSTTRAALALGLLLLVVACAAPLGPVRHDPITPDEVHEHVAYFASDELLGREAGTDGERLAAAYIIKRLEVLPRMQPGGEDGWLQAFTVPASLMPTGPAFSAVAERQPPEDETALSDAELADQAAEAGALEQAAGDEAAQGESVVAHNVLAVLPGSDPELAHEVIVLGAHYDHVGLGEHGNSLTMLDFDAAPLADRIHNGADDNASGSAVLLELAESLSTASRRPRRTLIFQWYSGEELGLLGSRHWVEHPSVDFERVVTMLNMDMVGRLTGSTLSVGGIGTNAAFEGPLRKHGQILGIELLLDPVGAAPSDNAPFHSAGVPVLFFFTGLHDDYHRPSDELSGLNARGAARVGRLIEAVFRDLDAIDSLPPFTAAPGAAYMFRPSAWLGLALMDTPAWVPGGALVSVVVDEGPAARGGLQQGDVILRVDGGRPLDAAAVEAAMSELDSARTPRHLQVWRNTSGRAVTEDDDWLDTHELIELSVRASVR